MIKPQTLKGFRDFLPGQAIKRQLVIGKIKDVFERFGFDPLETPALEYAETLMGKYGDEADKLLYLFEDNGGRKVGLRYDQTVPFSRVIAQYPDLPKPFKRYQIQPVWRAENTQKGRFREFLQCDIDTVGTQAPLADAEIIDCVLTAMKTLGFTKPVMHINDRTLFDSLGLSKKEIIIIDKLDKIGKDAVIEELTRVGRANAAQLFETLRTSPPPERLMQIMTSLTSQGYKEDVDFRFDPFLARGLDYYTSTIFELKVAEYPSGSLAGGGRYDDLIGSFTGTPIPAVGIAFGFDRLVEAMEELSLLPATATSATVLVTTFSPELERGSIEVTKKLRDASIHAEMYLSATDKLEKQLKYANKKGIPYVIVQGPDETARGVVQLKEMDAKKQEELTVDQVIEKLTVAN